MESKKQTQEQEGNPDHKDNEFFDDDEDDNATHTADGRLKKKSSYTYWVQNNKEQFP